MIHMLTIFRRHVKSCEHVAEGRKYRRCKCPIHAEGTLEGRPVRQSLDTNNWQRATEIIREWETNGYPALIEQEQKQPTIREACEKFKDDAAARKLAPSTLKKYRVLTDQFVDFCDKLGPQYLSQLTLDEVRKFRQSWKDNNIAAAKKLERLKSVYRFFAASGWTENHAAKLSAPVVTDVPTLPFTSSQMVDILAAVRLVPCMNERTQHELNALVLLMRYSGLRIGDAVQLHESRLDGSRLLLYTAKTKVPVYVPLPDSVIHRLAFVRRSTGHFFSSGIAKADTDASNWRRRFRKLFKIANMIGCHPHQFRDTFAVELLNAGVAIEQVSMLLGHRSVKITEKHYSPWVKSRQQQLDAAVSAAIANETNHTYSTREVTQ